MPHPHAPRPMSASRVQLAQFMNPEHANTLGNVHGGWIMKLVDEAGALASTRHAGHRTVTVAIDQMVFHQPIRIGQLVILEARVTYAGHTSMEVEVSVTAEDPISGVRNETNTAYLVYVAIDGRGRPTQVPPLLAETGEEQAVHQDALERQQRRLAQKVKP